jgi:hypothetical protein
MVTSVTSILCSSVCLWALYFRDSAYRRHVLELTKHYTLPVTETCLARAKRNPQLDDSRAHPGYPLVLLPKILLGQCEGTLTSYVYILARIFP